jgi:hypothetical protein
MSTEIFEHIIQLENKNRSERNKYIKNYITELGLKYFVHEFQSGIFKGENIILNFSDQNETGTHVIFSAHYDAVSMSPGANDNASGVAVLLDVAEKMAGKNQPLKIIFFDLEEKMPLARGSREYVRKFGTADVKFMVNLDMVGIGNTAIIWAHESEKNSDRVNMISETFENLSAKTLVFKPSIPLSPIGFPRMTSDHEPFIQSGFLQAYSVTMVPEEDMAFKEVIEKKRIFHFLGSAIRYHLLKTGSYPKIFRHYHCKGDTSKFIEPYALEVVSEALVRILLK